MSILKTSLFFIFFIAIPCFSQNSDESCYININCTDFNLLIEEKEVLIVDVRLHKEFRKERIKDAYIASSQEALKMLLENVDHAKYILVYCQEGSRSKTACEIICKELKFKYVFNLDGGLDQWKKKGYILEKERLHKQSN